jgi:hypothetical protein
LKVDNEAVKGAFPSLYANLAECHEELGNVGKAKEYQDLALVPASQPYDKGPFYHGTRADLQVGDFLTASRNSNYQSELVITISTLRPLLCF